MNKSFRRVLMCLIVAGATLAVAPEASAQSRPNQAPTLTIPKPKGEPKATPYTSILTAIIIGGVVLGVALMPSKRGHQD